jgi:radical SAM-linked protein
MIDNTPIKQRLHITFGKYDALVYTGNLDIAKLWERVLRRADLPILYSEGFNPRPRLTLASALPLGISSECEILDVSLRESIPLDGLAERLTATSPAGLRIFVIAEVPVRSPTLTQHIRSAEYRVTLDTETDLGGLQERIAALLASDHFAQERERKGKPITTNARNLIYDVRLDADGQLLLHLSTGDQGNLRPDELIRALGLDHHYLTIHRYRLHLSTP